MTKKRWLFLTLGLRFTLFLHTRFRLCCSSSKMCTCSVSLRSEPESSEPLSNKSYSGNKTKYTKKIIKCMHIIIVPERWEHIPVPVQKHLCIHCTSHYFSLPPKYILLIKILYYKYKRGRISSNIWCHTVGNKIHQVQYLFMHTYLDPFSFFSDM